MVGWMENEVPESERNHESTAIHFVHRRGGAYGLNYMYATSGEGCLNECLDV